MRARHLTAVALLVIPIIFVLLWHLCNRELPNDDGADYAMTALQIARQFNQGPLAGIVAVVNTRGLRPIAFGAFSVPFLLLTHGDVVAACAATLLAIYLALTFYLYRLARLFSADPLVAAATSAAVLSMPVVISYSLVFFSESAWLLFSVACIYHLLRSGPFRAPTHALAAGFYGALMGTIRPVESFVILTVFLAFLVIPEFQSKRLTLRSSSIVIGIFSVPASLLVGSSWVAGITRLDIWVAAIVAVTLGVLLMRRFNSSLVVFFGALTSVSCFWWSGFMPALLAWAHEATTFNRTVRVTEMSSAYQIAQTLLRQTQDYGQVQLGVVICLGILLFATAITRREESKEDTAPREGSTAPAWLLLYASATMLLLFVAAYSIGGSDRRRSLVALALLALSVTVIAATRSRLAFAAVVCLIAVQFTVIGSALAGFPVWAAANGFGIPSPHRAPDGNIEAARALAKYVPQGNNVAVYTLALFSPTDRIYEPNALKLALLQGEYGFGSGYYWDSEFYDETLARLYQNNFKYLLLDSFSVVKPTASHVPYAHLAVELLRRVRAGETENPKLRMIAQFHLGTRDQMLFRIMPNLPANGYDSLAAEWNGSKAVATEQQKGFPISNLNDGTESAWGSLEGKSDVYAGVVLPTPTAIHTLRLRLMTPNGRAHLRNIRIVTADREGPNGPEWQFVRARVKGSKDFATVLTIPPSQDNSVVVIEIDQKDPQWHSRLIWGFACLRSQGDTPNYLTEGSGVYVRELEVE